MRIVTVWIYATVLVFMVSLGWWVSMPIVFGVARNLSMTNQPMRNARLAIEYANIAWGPLLIAFILLWAIVSSSKRDVESIVYG